MKDPIYQVVFDGTLTGELDPAEARKSFARLFRITEQRAERYFSGEPHILKRGLSESAAMDYMIRVAGAGCECYIEELVAGPPAGISERRDHRERRHRFRREPRPGTIVPDRRLQIRREEDQHRFKRLHESHQELPLAFRSYTLNSLKYSQERS